MEIGAMRYFDIQKFAVILAYLVLLCIVALVSAKKVMSNVPDAATQLKEFGDCSSALLEGFKKCLICGRSHAGPEESIINGDPVEPPNKYPWMVQLKFTNSGFCGGAILDGHHILTAAHCMLEDEDCTGPQESCKVKPDEIMIMLLTSHSKGLNKGPPVEEVFIHPQFKLLTKPYNDIAVLKLKNPITCSAFASPICLPSSNFSVPAKSMLNIAGWGDTGHESEDQNSTPPPLLEANVMAVDVSRCDFNQKSETGVHCVVGADTKAPCFGDSGGPMFFGEKVFYTLGIASAVASETCDAKSPVIYTDVSKFLKYIQKITGLQSAQAIELERKKGEKRNNKRRT